MMIERRTRIVVWLIALLILCLVVELPIVYLRGTLTQDSSVKNLTLYSGDGYIEAQWKMVEAFNLQEIQIDVTDDSGSAVFSTRCAPEKDSFSFTQGEHGKAYHMGVTLILEDGTRSKQVWERAMFLHYGDLPDIPFLNVETVNRVKPTYRPVEPPELCLGYSITDNDYVSAKITMTNQGSQVMSEPGRIRIRGNTSATLEDRKPYKLQLEKPVDMISTGEYAHTEWWLLPFIDLKLITGLETALLCGIQWEPRYRLVNLMVSGDYLGVYLVIESITKDVNRCNISDSGYIIELDAYWWNSDGVYFRTDGQETNTGYTFKYPDDRTITAKKIEAIKSYMNQLKHYLSTGDSRYAEYIDLQSWADWLLTQDVMGNGDPAGSNLYYIKYDYDPDNPTSTKLMMGPTWDFSATFRYVNEWALIHTNHKESGFALIHLQPDFQKAYLKRWEQVYPTLCHDVVETITAWTEGMGQGFEDSLALTSVRWEMERRNIEAEIDAVEDWFSSRIQWMISQPDMN